MALICTSCGTPNPDSSRFCSDCATALTRPVVVLEKPAAPPAEAQPPVVAAPPQAYERWLLPGILGIIGLVIVLGIFGVIKGDPHPADGAALVGPTLTPLPTATTPAEVIATQRAMPTNTPEPGPQVTSVAPTDILPAATAAPVIGVVGQRMEVKQVGLTVERVSKADKVGTFSQAGPGNTYYLVDVAIDNAWTGEEPYNLFYFKLKDADAFEYQNDFMAETDHPLHSGSLKPGEKVRGTLAFKVPTSAHGLVLTYEPGGLGYEPIRIALSAK